ncbi:unnamed protein product [Darwinula stevensoni]|uniref:Uncharacterized protein n=1 Tax=Darwinula stevensoni TaxID=69355 RepID=A0A7R9A831_9CRUS|nr:unnamed protein product [Darwinula stevensoni]CAG0894877.1 unnamed protein product [Darwinula stevensoni]
MEQCEKKMGKTLGMAGMLLVVMVILACLSKSVDGVDSCQIGGVAACIRMSSLFQVDCPRPPRKNK